MVEQLLWDWQLRSGSSSLCKTHRSGEVILLTKRVTCPNPSVSEDKWRWHMTVKMKVRNTGRDGWHD